MMKRSITSLGLVAALAVGAVGVAHAETQPGWYLSAGTGLTFIPDSKVRQPGTSNKLDYNPGWNLNVAGGYALGNGFRFEGEYSFDRASVDKVSGPSTGASGALDQHNFFANAYYDIDTGTSITPYVGAGVGVAIVDANDLGGLSGGTTTSSTRARFAYQGIVGASMALNDQWSVTADYRYIGTTDPEYKTSAGVSTHDENASHNVVFGLRYAFDTPPAPPKEEPAPPPPAPVAAAPAKKIIETALPAPFIVYFGFNKADLDADAKSTISDAVKAISQYHVVKISVEGNTDTVGSSPYNQKLSEKRAVAVQKALVALGVPENEQQVVAYGKTHLKVATPDQTKEPRNRRVEIHLEQ